MLLSGTREKLPELIGTHLLSRISTSLFQVPVDTNYGASGTREKKTRTEINIGLASQMKY